MRARTTSLVFILIASSLSMWAQQPVAEDIDGLARRVAGDGTAIARAQRLVEWINTSFSWTATDYQQRTVEEIIQRRGGNCAELSRVLARMLPPTGIRYRWVAEINLHPYTPRRQETAAKKVAESGPRMSVFGLRHNDHRWLEVYDEQQHEWVPADPAVGVVGSSEWVGFRMGLVSRRKPAVPAVAEIVQDMIVPFAVVALNAEKKEPEENRSQHYLIDEFDRAYGGKLSSLPAWTDWVAMVRELSDRASGAFSGKVNLHDSNDRIARLAEVYEQLRRQAKAAGLP